MRDRPLALTGGAALGGLVTLATRRQSTAAEILVARAGLVTAAALYPMARRTMRTPGMTTETAVLVVAAALAGRSTGGAARRLLAVGWLSHAVFDACVGRSEDSRLPAWYPAFCAGYDVGVGAVLLQPLQDVVRALEE